MLAKSVFVSIAYFHYGKENQNPVDHVQFFNKSRQKLVYKTEHVSFMLSKRSHERYVRVYGKSRDEVVDVSKCVKVWCHDHKIRRVFQMTTNGVVCRKRMDKTVFVPIGKMSQM